MELHEKQQIVVKLEVDLQGKGEQDAATSEQFAVAKVVGDSDAQEIKKLRRDLAVAKKRFEREESLAAERGADIEDLKERIQALQDASKQFHAVASEAEMREKRCAANV